MLFFGENSLEIGFGNDVCSACVQCMCGLQLL